MTRLVGDASSGGVCAATRAETRRPAHGPQAQTAQTAVSLCPQAHKAACRSMASPTQPRRDPGTVGYDSSCW